jgi:hypothetical protein
MIRRTILKIGRTLYVRAAIAERADLAAFREKPAPMVLAGVFAIGFSYVIGWPAVAALGYLSVRSGNHWIVAVGGPLTYGLSHLVFLLGMYLSGMTYSLIFLRWFTRVSMERLLAWAETDRETGA